MTAGLRGILARYGRDVTVVHGDTHSAGKAFFELMTSSGAAPYQVTETGAADDRRWLALTDAPLSDGDILRCGGTDYDVDTCAPVYLGNTLSHWRGVLEKRRGTA